MDFHAANRGSFLGSTIMLPSFWGHLCLANPEDAEVPMVRELTLRQVGESIGATIECPSRVIVALGQLV